jgi:hypothetical protein
MRGRVLKRFYRFWMIATCYMILSATFVCAKLQAAPQSVAGSILEFDTASDNLEENDCWEDDTKPVATSTREWINFQKPTDAQQLIGPEGSQLIPENPKIASQWIFSQGVLTASPKWDSVVTAESYQDFVLHIEFNVNTSGAVEHERDGNSGLYLQLRYELQILNSFNVPFEQYKKIDCGCIYGMKKPDQMACLPAGQWQSFDVAFRAARFDNGKKIENARITVYQNQKLIHDDFTLPRHTGAGKKEGPEALPIKLQGHHNQVQFRNFWIKRW